MNLRRACNALLLGLAVADAFAPAMNTHTRRVTTLMAQVEEGKQNTPMQRLVRGFGVAAAVLTFSATANASPMNHEQDPFFAVYSSSMPIAGDTIKTMDMSLPSSYSAISDVKNRATDELTQEENLVTGKKTKVKKADTSKSEPAQKLSAEERVALAAQKKAEREAAAADKAAGKESLVAERAAEREALAAEKAAARAAEKAEKDAAKAAAKAAAQELAAKNAQKKEAMEMEKKFAGVEIVDTGLPSYEPAASGKRSGAFAL
mmetsp:Transcript_14274/g.20094  ORF Transcript_14274/g.20094 Transcript_14274/m.20094 type:complete len:262 (+) Transcript_14274:149-934(+)